MLRLAVTLYSLIGTTLAGSAIVVALVMGRDTLVPLVVAAAIGFALAIPVSVGVARALTQGEGGG